MTTSTYFSTILAKQHDLDLKTFKLSKTKAVKGHLIFIQKNSFK
jgi:hypothetical protein